MARKANTIKEIGDGITSPLKMEGYAIFGDNWINADDEILFDKDLKEYLIIDFMELERNVCIFMQSYIPYGVNPWQIRKFSAVKLDKTVEIGDIFYTSKLYI